MRKQRYVPKHLAPKPGRAAKTARTVKPVRVSEPRVPKRRSYGFLIFLIVFTLLMLGGICAGAFYLWDYLESFEISRPEHIIEHISANIDYDFWQRSAEAALAPRLTYFENDVFSALEPHLPGILDVHYSIRLRPEESTDELLVYTVRAGASDIGIVRFTPMEEAGHGFFVWGVDSMEMLDSFLDPFSRSITVTASQNASVELNGIPVTGEYIIECEYEYGTTYQIDNLYGTVDVTVIEFDGQRPEPVFAQDDEYYFPITIPFSVNHNFIVPYGALVYAGGELVSADNITDSQIIPSIFRGIVEQADNPDIASSRYEFGFSEIYTGPVITVTNAQGIKLESFINDDGDIVYKEEYSEALKAAHADTAEAFIRAYVNFSSNTGGGPASNLAVLGNYMQRNSTLFRHLQNAVTTRTWTQISQVTFHEIKADNFKQYGDSLFTCEVFYSLTQRGAADTVDIEMLYEILFTLSGDGWYVVNVLAVDR